MKINTKSHHAIVLKMFFNILMVCIICIIAGSSCKKFLDTKSVQNLSTPSSLSDLEALLNNSGMASGTTLLNGMTDEYYFLYSDWLTRIELHKKAFAWEADLNDYNDWIIQYQNVFYANTVLFNLESITRNNDPQRWDAIKGGALFYRSLAFWRIALLFAPQYDDATANTDPGIPLRLSANITDVSVRGTVKQSYEQIIADLSAAVNLLPGNPPTNQVSKTQPTQAAAYGLLAKVYLQIGNYAKAKETADACLAIHNTLMDYNDVAWVAPGSSSPFLKYNAEVIFHSMADASPNVSSRAKIDSVLYASYAMDDLRKTAFYSQNADNTYRFKGSYSSGSLELFCGIATDETLLIRAEASARAGNTADAMKDLNDLLKTRWKKVNGASSYVNQTAANAADALSKILTERKKELVYREVRWADLKRLNKEAAFAIAIKRNLNGPVVLSPNDPKYTLLIPREVIQVTSLPQNPR